MCSLTTLGTIGDMKAEVQCQIFMCGATIRRFFIQLGPILERCTAGPDSLLHQAWFGSMRGEGRCKRRGGKEDHSAGAECGSALWRNT